MRHRRFPPALREHVRGLGAIRLRLFGWHLSGEAPLRGGGSVLSWAGAHVALSTTVQLSNPGGNVSTGDSFLSAGGGSVLVGDTHVDGFSRALISADSSVTGNLICVEGGDAYCGDPAKVSGSTCSQCPKP